MVLLVLVVQQLVSQDLDIFFDLNQKLDLVLLDCTSDFWSSQKSCEDLEHSEHLVGILSL